MGNKNKTINIKAKHGTFRCIFKWDKKDKAYLVDVPSLPGTYTFGKNLSEAKYMARDVIDLMCEVLIDDGNIIIDDEKIVIGNIPHSHVISVR